jgi:nucleoside-diphosphate-sugar epimerase
MRILVVGGTRFIGLWVVRRLAEAGHEVSVFHRGQSRAVLPEGVAEVLGERRDRVALEAAVRQARPEVVLDMIAMTEEQARTAIQAFEGQASRVVAVSSQDVYRAYGRLIGKEPGPPEPGPLSEDAPLREALYPHRGTGEASEHYEKILVERAYLGVPALPATVLRLPMVYGPSDRQHRLHGYLKRMDDGRPALLIPERLARWRWTRGYVEDVAAAIELAVTDGRAAGRVYNVGEPSALTMEEWAWAIARAAGWRGQVLRVQEELVPEHLKMPIVPEHDVVTDSGRIRRELGFREAVPFEEALRWTVAWERANPPMTVDPQDFDYEAEDAVLRRLGIP